MPTTLTLKSIPDEIYQKLKASAEAHRRSLNSEALVCLETVLLPGKMPPAERLARARALRASLPQGKLRASDIDALEARRPPMIVVDTNVLAYFLLPYEFSAAADAVFERDPDWAAPILGEASSGIFSLASFAGKNLSFDEVLAVQADAEALLAGREYEVASRRVLELVRDSHCTAYDCEFVALGIQLGVKLVTADKKVLKAFPQHTTAIPAA